MNKKKLQLLAVACLTLLLSSCLGKQQTNLQAKEPNPVDENMTLNISSYKDNEYLQEATKKYEQTHEGVTIKINEYISESDSKSKTDKNSDKYSQIVNTALLSGNGDDIIDTSPLSYFKLANKNMLADLNPYIGNDLNNNNYYMNILDAYLFNGKRYTVPLSFMYTAYSINGEAAKKYDLDNKDTHLTSESLLAFSDKLPKDGKVMLFDDSGSGMSDVDLAYQIFSLNSKQFINIQTNQVSIDNASFRSILEAVKKISEHKQIATQKGYDKGENFYTKDTKALINQFTLYSPAMCQSGTVDYASLNLKLLANKEGYSTFSTVGFMPAISNTSNNKALAADFIKYLLSKDIQTSTELLFCPVNKNSVKEASRLIYADSKAGGYLPDGFTEQNLETNTIQYNKLLDNATITEYADKNIRDFITKEISLYFSGKETSDQASKNLQTKLSTYMKE